MTEIIDSKELARRWRVPPTWIGQQVRSSAVDPIPHVKLGKYVRFEWGSEALEGWWDARRRNKSPESAEQKQQESALKIEAARERGTRLAREAISR
jgi:hypothetical protein